MPRFLLEQLQGEPLDEADAARLSAERFPEVAVEHRYQVRGDRRERELWVCRAPSELHLRRWAEATGLGVVVIEHVDADAPPGRRSPDRPPDRPPGRSTDQRHKETGQ